MTVTKMKRELILKQGSNRDVILSDFNPQLPIGKIASHYATQYPEMTNAQWTKEVKGDKEVFTFKTSVGTKG